MIVLGKDSSEFDASAYWQERVGAGADVTVVGHRAMGHAYNREIYARRIEALESMLEHHLEKPLGQLRVLDIGCGSGIYTGFWQAKGVGDYTGLDISARTIDYLSGMYSEYRFVHADITKALPAAIADRGPFDVITVFDVLYHIVDTQNFLSAIRNINGQLDGDGKLLIMDFLSRNEYRISDHVVYRAREGYLARFHEHHLGLADSEQLFHFLVPPISGVRFIDLCVAVAFNVFGRVVRLNDRIAAWFAVKVRRLDTRMRRRNVSLQNGELLVFARNSASDG